MKKTCTGDLACLALIFILLVVNGFWAIGCESATPSAYDEYLRAAGKVWDFQGVVLVSRGDSIVFQQGYGKADIETGRNNTVDTKFALGIMTKQFTAAAILQLVERGQIDLDSTICTYLPEYPPETGSRITIHHLLSLTSGIPESPPDLRRLMVAGKPVTPEELVSTFKFLPLDFEPGSQLSNSFTTCEYILLGRIIERVTGQSYKDYIMTNILKPAMMKQSGVNYDHAERDDFARGYSFNVDRSIEEVPDIHLSVLYSAGALCSTVGDLYR